MTITSKPIMTLRAKAAKQSVDDTSLGDAIIISSLCIAHIRRRRVVQTHVRV